jgi:hypothetical protein
MARLNFPLSHPQSKLVASPWVYSLENMERKEPSDIQLLLNELARNMVQNPLQHQGNNQQVLVPPLTTTKERSFS